ncbi:MAG: ferritin [Elusimicrobiota bacterium]|jgi:ferritin
MLNKKMLAALNAHAVKEFYSAYLYMSMSAWFERENLPGLAKWMRTQVQEESCHGLIFFNYLCEQGARVVLGGIEAPPADFKSAVAVFEKTVSHEREVSASIHSLVDLSIQEKDHPTKQFLEWFVKEQVEEEATAENMLAQLKRIGDGQGLYLFDKDAATRVFTLPVPLTGKI